jgi:hypothetical protein
MATSKYTGVRAERGIWRADIQVDKKKKFLGYFKSEIAAAQAYNDAVTRMGLKRRLNKIAVIQPPTNGTMQLMSGRSVLFQALGITSVSVEVSHNKLITLRDAVKLAINNKIKDKLQFSAHDITTWIREGSQMGEFALTDAAFHYESGEWIQKVDHEKVREIVHELYDTQHFSASKRDNGVYISYSP